MEQYVCIKSWHSDSSYITQCLVKTSQWRHVMLWRSAGLFIFWAIELKIWPYLCPCHATAGCLLSFAFECCEKKVFLNSGERRQEMSYLLRVTHKTCCNVPLVCICAPRSSKVEGSRAINFPSSSTFSVFLLYSICIAEPRNLGQIFPVHARAGWSWK